MDIKLLRCDDWEGIFANGKLVAEGHSLTAQDVLDCLDIDYNTGWINQEWMEYQGVFPANVEDIPEEAYDD